MEVHGRGQEPVRLTAGDVAAFSAGTTSTWTVHTPLRKFFVISG